MRSLVIDQVDSCHFADVPERSIGPREVLLDVCHVGLCGSDLNTFTGLNPLVSLPRIPGHEIGGTILEVGEDVEPKLTVGSRAIVIPYTTCGICASCKTGRVNACQFNRTLGVQQDGGLRERIVVNHDRLILNDTLKPAHLALVEPLSVGFHAVRRGGVAASETVVVLGGGMIGVGAVLGAIARGARVIVSEIAENKHTTLLDLGVEAVINPESEDLTAALQTHIGINGPDVVIEAVGQAQTFRKAIDLASYAGRVVYVGYAKDEVTYNTSVFNLKELDILGSRNATRSDFEAVIAYLETKPEVAEPLISKVFRWDDADEAFAYWVQNRESVFKILIDMKA